MIEYSFISRKFLKIYYLGECHCQNNFLEHYNDQGNLHCLQPDDGNFDVRQIFSGYGFEIPKCESGQSFDIITKKCEKTSSHNNTQNGPIGGKKNTNS